MLTWSLCMTWLRGAHAHNRYGVARHAPSTGIRRGVALIVACVLAVGVADAWGSGMRQAAPARSNPRWQAECGSCHVAYPPALLPAGDWRRIMARLDRHFGTDASLDPAVAGEIEGFLEQNAGGAQPGASSDGAPRITQTRWFLRKHREVPLPVWTRAGVGSAANCSACHTGAAAGDFRERNIRIPVR